jgi:hypothetical protein
VVMLEEHRSVPWNALPGQMVDVGEGELLSTEPIMMGFILLTCENRRVGVGDGEGTDAFVVYSTGYQGVDDGRSTITYSCEQLQLSFLTKAITLAFKPGQCFRPQANQPIVAQRITKA